MTTEPNSLLHYPSLGECLSKLQQTVRVGRTLLRNADLCEKTGMCPRTYARVKRANVQTSPSI